MGQYFIFVNFDKKEYFVPQLMKMSEILGNCDANLLAYLLFTNNLDGTSLIRSNNFGWDDEKAREEWGDFEKIKVGDNSYIYIPKLKYLGRWCCDRIGIIGDYFYDATNYDGPSWEKIDKHYADITKELREEFERVFPEFAKNIKPKFIRLDMTISAQP